MLTRERLIQINQNTVEMLTRETFDVKQPEYRVAVKVHLLQFLACSCS